MSVFQGATNVAIHGGVFNAVANTVANVGAQDDILGTLYARSAPAGLLDAAERFDAPKCDEGTRTSMIHGMQKFVQEGGATSSSALYWLHGPAGVGKSALAQSVSLLLKGQADHAASFFFSRTSPGRNNGNQLVVTLAYQLAVNLPALQPFMSRIVRTNPAVLAASNAVQMQSLIIDSVNQWQKEAKGGTIRRWRRKIFNIKKRPHPRLILVDGLDECNDPQVQRDLLLCIALAVRHLSLPFRFIVTSRPEPHILATFELDPTFQGPDGVSVLTKNLGDDEDADEQITTFLLKEFAEIRRTHPIREFLPKVWPLPGQIAQLVSKSSKVFIYPATVIRYIKMANNRPDECLERILGLEDIPIEDKPYEPLDILYRHIFGSVPNANKEAVWNIFHFLVVPYTCRPRPITSRRIEQHFDYKPGHVQHVLRDLLCIVSVTGETIKVLHASLPDFLLDPSRSGSLCIDISNAHAAIAASFPLAVSDMAELPDFRFNGFLEHIMQANISSALVQRRLVGMDFSARYIRFFAIYFRVGNRKSSRSVQDRLDGITFVVAYLLVLVIKNVQQIEIRRHITEIKGYILHNSPLAASLYAVRDEIFSVMIRLFRNWASSLTDNQYIKDIFAFEMSPSQCDIREDLFELYCCMVIPAADCAASTAGGSHDPQGPHLPHQIRQLSDHWNYISCTLLELLLNRYPVPRIRTSNKLLAVGILGVSLAHAGYSVYLITPLSKLLVPRDTPSDMGVRDHYPKLAPSVVDYLKRVFPEAPAASQPRILALKSQWMQEK